MRAATCRTEVLEYGHIPISPWLSHFDSITSLQTLRLDLLRQGVNDQHGRCFVTPSVISAALDVNPQQIQILLGLLVGVVHDENAVHRGEDGTPTAVDVFPLILFLLSHYYARDAMKVDTADIWPSDHPGSFQAEPSSPMRLTRVWSKEQAHLRTHLPATRQCMQEYLQYQETLYKGFSTFLHNHADDIILFISDINQNAIDDSTDGMDILDGGQPGSNILPESLRDVEVDRLGFLLSFSDDEMEIRDQEERKNVDLISNMGEMIMAMDASQPTSPTITNLTAGTATNSTSPLKCNDDDRNGDALLRATRQPTSLVYKRKHKKKVSTILKENSNDDDMMMNIHHMNSSNTTSPTIGTTITTTMTTASGGTGGTGSHMQYLPHIEYTGNIPTAVLLDWIKESFRSSITPASTTPQNEGFDPDIMLGTTPSPPRMSMFNQLVSPMLSMLSPSDVHNIHRATVLRGESDMKGGTIRILDCHDAVVYCLAPLNYATISCCTDCIIVLGAIGNALRVDRCERVQIIAATASVTINTCHDCILYLGTNRPPLMLGDNRFVQLAPHNTGYEKLVDHMDSAGVKLSPNMWSIATPLLLDHSKQQQQQHSSLYHQQQMQQQHYYFNDSSLFLGQSHQVPPPPSATLLPPEKLMPFLVPFRGGKGPMCGGPAQSQRPIPSHSAEDALTGLLTQAEFNSGAFAPSPYPMPAEYSAAWEQKMNGVAAVRSLYSKAQLTDGQKKEFMVAVQSHFKDWLQGGGGMREVYDLAKVEKERSREQQQQQQGHNNSSSAYDSYQI